MLLVLGRANIELRKGLYTNWDAKGLHLTSQPRIFCHVQKWTIRPLGLSLVNFLKHARNTKNTKLLALHAINFIYSYFKKEMQVYVIFDSKIMWRGGLFLLVIIYLKVATLPCGERRLGESLNQKRRLDYKSPLLSSLDFIMSSLLKPPAHKHVILYKINLITS